MGVFFLCMNDRKVKYVWEINVLWWSNAERKKDFPKGTIKYILSYYIKDVSNNQV